MFKYVKFHKCTWIFFYLTVAAALKRCDFLPLHHYTSHIKDMKQRTAEMGSKDSNIYQKAYQQAWMNICMTVFYFFPISFWYRRFVWKLLKLSLLSFTFQVANAFSKSVWTCYFCFLMSFTQVLQIYHPSITNETTEQSLEFHLVSLNSFTQLTC